jgi:hypothetical protein
MIVRNVWPVFVLAVVPGLCAALACAAEPEPYLCRRATGPITLDGKADEAAWRAAGAIDHFHLPWLGARDRPAKTKTVARLLWDDDYLYFHAEMEDHDLYADITEHDGMTWENDVFELFFKPADKAKGYYEFQVSAAGTKMDMFLPSRGSGGYRRWKGAHPFAWETRVARDGTLNDPSDRDRGWSVEGRFPWKDFAPTGGRPARGDVWKFALCRYDYSIDFDDPELSTHAPLQALNFHRHEDYAPLRFAD